MRSMFMVSFACLAVALIRQAGGEAIVHPSTVTPLGAHVCTGFYPEASREAHAGGVVSLAFRINANGTVSEVAVTGASGNADLDDAAKSCVRTWRYVPVQKDGKPVDAAWNASVEFKPVVPEPEPAAQLPVLVEQDRKACTRYPWWAQRHHAEGNATLKYVVTPQGAVSDVVMSKSSGDSDLDNAAMSCIKSLKYRPLSGGDTPKPVTAQASWSYLDHAPSLVRWKFLGASSSLNEAMQQIKLGVGECLRKAASHADFASGFAGITTLRARYRRGEITAVSVVSTSGNDGLDRYAADCYQAETSDAERTEVLRGIDAGTFHVVWQQYVHP